MTDDSGKQDTTPADEIAVLCGGCEDSGVHLVIWDNCISASKLTGQTLTCKNSERHISRAEARTSNVARLETPQPISL
jgi:hypothetical protein